MSRRRAAMWAVPALAALALSACASSDTKSDSPSSSSAAPATSSASGSAAPAAPEPSGTVALLLPETKTTRYESADKPYFTEALTKLCPKCELSYANADQDEAKQLQQAQAALTKGAKVLVLDPVNGKTAGAIVDAAKAKNVPVISYDRLITAGGTTPVDYYISFDNERVGQLQATELLKQLDANGKSGEIVWINGSPTDNNATLFAKGAHSVIPTGGTDKYKISYEIATPDWSPDKAQTEMSAAITQIGKDKIVGVYSANDGMATGLVAAMKNAGFTTIPPLTGQDAEVAGVQRILTGEQSMTVYKAVRPEAEAAAELAVALLKGEKPTTVAGKPLASTMAGDNAIPSVLLTPVAVTKANVKETVFADQYHTPAEVCVGAVADACKAAGIS